MECVFTIRIGGSRLIKAALPPQFLFQCCKTGDRYFKEIVSFLSDVLILRSPRIASITTASSASVVSNAVSCASAFIILKICPRSRRRGFSRLRSFCFCTIAARRRGSGIHCSIYFPGKMILNIVAIPSSACFCFL